MERVSSKPLRKASDDQPPPRIRERRRSWTGPHDPASGLLATSSICPPVGKSGVAWLWITTPIRMALTLSKTRSSEAARRVNFRICPKLSSSMTVSAPSERASGLGSAFLLILPLGSRGSSSRPSKRWGTMYATKRPLQWSLSVAGTAGTTYATSWSSYTVTTVALTSGCELTAASTSPSSMRAPRTFTMESLRPTIFKFPSGVHLPKSPERAVRAPPRAFNEGRNVSAVFSGNCRYPEARPGPETLTSPTPPGPTGLKPKSKTARRWPVCGLPAPM
mmetsp:Transcript_24557/g.70603  ORF Transcript_24557/g.70603 Transcript_24557/m.70603 type:complete len:277 (-) Transcript_24557:1877-2707(-)